MTMEHYEAARSGAAVVRMNWMGILSLTGSERKSWLQGMVTNEVEKLSTGQGCYAAHLNAQGKIVAHMIVLVGADELLLLLERTATEKLAAVFDKLIIMEDVQVRDVSDEFAVLGLLGLPPTRDKVLAGALGQPLAAQQLYEHQVVSQMRVLTGDLGYTVIATRESADRFLGRAVTAGAIEINQETWNVVRTEAGLPLYGVDIDETTTMPELGQRGISYDKGCYIGQEVVARIKYIGHVNRRFVGFICEGSVVPESRSVVQVNGKDAGYVTTAVFSPAVSKAIALGFVNRAASAAGTAVILRGETEVHALVVELPFL